MDDAAVWRCSGQRKSPKSRVTRFESPPESLDSQWITAEQVKIPRPSPKPCRAVIARLTIKAPKCEGPANRDLLKPCLGSPPPSLGFAAETRGSARRL